MMRRGATAIAALIAIAVTGCGGGGSGSSGDAITKAKPLTLLPATADAPEGMDFSTRPYELDLGSSAALISTFSDPGSIAKQLDGAGEADFSGAQSSAAYAHVYIFKTIDDATAATADFLKTNALTTSLGNPISAGDESEASTQTYAEGKSTSFRVVFRDQNVLSYVEVDGVNGSFKVGDAADLANSITAKIDATL